MSKLVTVTLDNTFNPKDIVVSEVAAPGKCGDMVKNPRAAIGHKSMKRVSAIPDQGRYRSNESYLYLLLDGTAIGIYKSYEYKQPKTEQNMKGFDLVIPLVSNRDSVDPGEDDEVYWALDGLHQRVVKHLVRNKESLPKQFRKMEDDELRACVRPPYSPKWKAKDGKWRSPSLTLPFKYFKADEKKGKKENLLTKCRGPGNKPFHPRDYLSIPGEKCVSGKIRAAIRVCHIGFSAKPDPKDLDNEIRSINYTLELANLNFTPRRGAEEPDLLGGNHDEEEDGAEEGLYNKEDLVDVEVDEELGDDDEASESPKKSRRRRRD